MAFQTRRKYCFFKENNITDVDYKDTKLLKRFTNDNGKIMPRRVTGTSAKMHRKVVSAIKRARIIGLMPFVDNGSEEFKWGKIMKVILMSNVENLGEAGDVITVKPGYARNKLIPMGLALRASKRNIAVAIEKK